MAPPNKEERAICWAAKDKYWNCLDKCEGKTDLCAALRKVYTESCSKTWVSFDASYF